MMKWYHDWLQKVDEMTSIIVYYPEGKYEDQEISLDGAVLEDAQIKFNVQRRNEYVFEDWNDLVEVSGILVPTPTHHDVDTRTMDEDIKGVLIIPIEKKKAHHLKFRAIGGIELQDKMCVVLKDIYFLSGAIKDLE